MSKELKVEKVRGKYQIWGLVVVALIGSGGLIYYLLPGKNSPIEESNKIEVKDNKSSPVANKIETQNNYYGKTPSEATDSIQEKSVPSNPIKPKKVKSQTDQPASKEPAPIEKREPTINADHALIVTNNQSGGSNTVVQQIPEPVLKPISHEKKTKRSMK